MATVGGKLMIGGLTSDSTVESLRLYFENFGVVDKVEMQREADDEKQHNGFALVEFAARENADSVLAQTEPHVINGVTVEPKLADPEPKSAAPAFVIVEEEIILEEEPEPERIACYLPDGSVKEKSSEESSEVPAIVIQPETPTAPPETPTEEVTPQNSPSAEVTQQETTVPAPGAE